MNAQERLPDERPPDEVWVEKIRKRLRDFPPEGLALLDQLRDSYAETVRACQAPLPAVRR